MKRSLLVLLLAVAGLAMARDTIDDWGRLSSGNAPLAAAAAESDGTGAPSVTVVIVDPDFLETYASELPYPYLLNPREALVLRGDWMEGDPYMYEDLFGAVTVRVQVEAAAQGSRSGSDPSGSLDPDFLETYAAELPYPYLLNPREVAEADPYTIEDLGGSSPTGTTTTQATSAQAAGAAASASAARGPSAVHAGPNQCRLTSD